MKVLCIGGSDTALDAVLATLRARGHDACRAASAECGLEALAHEQPDLVLVAHQPPGLDAFALARELRRRAHGPWFPVFLLGADDAPSMLARTLESGADDWLALAPDMPTLGAHIALAERIAELRQRLEAAGEALAQADRRLLRASRVDGLTGAANRAQFDDTLQAEWRRALRAGQPLALLIIDLDHFRQYNLGYGHTRGDECLVRIAALLRRALQRPADSLARYRGETFAVLLPDTAETGALGLARRLVEAVRAARLPHEHSPVADHVTVSVGCAALTPTPDASPETLLAHAEAALAEAKRWGRNRATRASEVPEFVPA